MMVVIAIHHTSMRKIRNRPVSVCKYMHHGEMGASAQCHASSHIPQLHGAVREKGSLTLHLQVNDSWPFVSNWILRHLHSDNKLQFWGRRDTSASKSKTSDKVHSALH